MTTAEPEQVNGMLKACNWRPRYHHGEDEMKWKRERINGSERWTLDTDTGHEIVVERDGASWRIILDGSRFYSEFSRERAKRSAVEIAQLIDLGVILERLGHGSYRATMPDGEVITGPNSGIVSCAQNRFDVENLREAGYSVEVAHDYHTVNGRVVSPEGQVWVGHDCLRQAIREMNLREVAP